MYVFTGLRSWIRLTEARGGQRFKARSRGTQDLSCWCSALPLCDLLHNAFLTFQSHLSASPTHPLLCALGKPRWLSQLIVPLMPPCLQTHAHSTWNTLLAFPFFVLYLYQQLPLPSRVTSSIAQFVKTFFITPMHFAFMPPFLYTFLFVQMSNVTINLFTYLFPSSPIDMESKDNLTSCM